MIDPLMIIQTLPKDDSVLEIAMNKAGFRQRLIKLCVDIAVQDIYIPEYNTKDKVK